MVRKYPLLSCRHDEQNATYSVYFGGTDRDGKFRYVRIDIPDVDIPGDRSEKKRLLIRIFRAPRQPSARGSPAQPFGWSE